MPRTPRRVADTDLQIIDGLERDIVLAFDQRMHLHAIDAAEVVRLRPGVVAQAHAVTEQLRAEHRARMGGVR